MKKPDLSPDFKVTEDDVHMDSGAAATFTYRNGFMVKFLPSMDILQTTSDTKK
jgi:hypothetical protein